MLLEKSKHAIPLAGFAASIFLKVWAANWMNENEPRSLVLHRRCCLFQLQSVFLHKSRAFVLHTHTFQYKRAGSWALQCEMNEFDENPCCLGLCAVSRAIQSSPEGPQTVVNYDIILLAVDEPRGDHYREHVSEIPTSQPDRQGGSRWRIVAYHTYFKSSSSRCGGGKHSFSGGFFLTQHSRTERH